MVGHGIKTAFLRQQADATYALKGHEKRSRKKNRKLRTVSGAIFAMTALVDEWFVDEFGLDAGLPDPELAERRAARDMFWLISRSSEALIREVACLPCPALHIPQWTTTIAPIQPPPARALFAAAAAAATAAASGCRRVSHHLSDTRRSSKINTHLMNGQSL